MTAPQFYFDFGSPNAYFCYKVIPEIEERTGTRFEWIPVLLGGIFKATDNQSPFMAYGNVKGKLAYDQLEMVRFQKAHGITSFQMNPHFPVNTLLLMRGAVAAQEAGQLKEYVDVGFRAMWEEGRKMDDPEVLVATLNEAGLDGDGLAAKTQDPDVKAKLVDNTSQAVERGAFGIPTFFVGDEMFFGKDRLVQVEAEIVAQS
ncbi:MAG: 2-hydroxychromene-2-carboxylate isomerase [Pseudomonadota bacterium]